MKIKKFGLILGATVVALLTLNNAQASEIHDLVKAGDVEAVKKALEADSSLVKARGENLGNTPLIVAVIEENAAMVKLLIEAGADVNGQNDRKRSAFWWAARRNQGTEVLSLLKENGANINAPGFLGSPPFLSAMVNENKVTVDFILDSGAELPSEQDKQYDMLFNAAAFGIPRVFNLMLDMVPGIDPKGQYAYGYLTAAAEGGSAEIITKFIELGIDPNITNDYKKVPLHIASA